MDMQYSDNPAAEEGRSVSRGRLDTEISGVLDGLSELHHALNHHLEWLKKIHNAIWMGTPADPDDLAEDAEHRCTFGRWYDGPHSKMLSERETFPELGVKHGAVHAGARVLLSQIGGERDIDRDVYAWFMDTVLDFNRLAQKLHIELLTRVATTDPLTGAFNRCLMERKLEEEWARFTRLGQPCAVALVDLDHFKQVNDRFGHRTGDLVLRQLADTLAHQLRAYDNLFFRYGGEEFLACLPGMVGGALPITLERLRQAVADYRLETSEGQSIQVTASVGAASFSDAASLEEVLHRADLALYTAKSGGRNQVHIWAEIDD